MIVTQECVASAVRALLSVGGPWGIGHVQTPNGMCRCGLFDGDGLGEVAGLVDVVALGLGD
jgi:hypothetical protein